jgi:hypothetical protein
MDMALPFSVVGRQAPLIAGSFRIGCGRSPECFEVSAAFDALDYGEEKAFNQSKWSDRLDQRN